MTARPGLLLSLGLLSVACGGSAPRDAARPRAVSAAMPSSSPAPGIPPPREDGRLPGGVAPTGYRWELLIDPSRPRFSGRVRIGIHVERPTRAVVLHARALHIRSAAVSGAGGGQAATWSSRRDAHSK